MSGQESGTAAVAIPYGSACRMLTLAQVCEWFNIGERHVRKLVERDAIPYRKVGHLLRFPERELDEWSRPTPKEHHPADDSATAAVAMSIASPAITPPRKRASVARLPKSLID